jgi:hypothetical protein
MVSGGHAGLFSTIYNLSGFLPNTSKLWWTFSGVPYELQELLYAVMPEGKNFAAQRFDRFLLCMISKGLLLHL